MGRRAGASDLPEPAISSSSTSLNDLGDVDAGVISNVRVVCASRNAEAQPSASL